MIIYGDNDDKILVKENFNHILPLTLFAIRGRGGGGEAHYASGRFFYLLWEHQGSLKKVKFLENC